jgi:hypothetical protein
MPSLPRLLLAAAVAVAYALHPAPVTAKCGAPLTPAQALDQASVAFVGTVTSVADDGYTATFDVQEIWKGTNLANPTTVYGGSAKVVESRTWAQGTRYLVFPTVDADGNLIDGTCSPTVEYTAALDGLRPASAHAPQGPPTSGVPGDPPIAAVFLVIVVFGTLGAVFLWRMGRPREDS